MNAIFSTFPWPIPPGANTAPVWTGSGFECDGRKEPVLCYAEHESHWSDELTELHEQEAGGSHPIDIASRQLALHTLKRYCGNPGALALEVGCSSGYLLEDIKAAMPHLAVIGSDYLVKSLRTLAPRLPTVPILQFDLRECPLPPDTFDAVVLLNVLEHIDDDEKALCHVGRILKPDGIAHIEVPANPGCYDIYDEHLMHHRRYRLGELVEKAQRAGFDVVKATRLGFFIFPAFYAVKQHNKKLLSLPKIEKQKIVASQIRQTRSNPIFALLMRLETALGKFVCYPCGIRCVVVLKKRRNQATHTGIPAMEFRPQYPDTTEK